jgi:hypothetical protein
LSYSSKRCLVSSAKVAGAFLGIDGIERATNTQAIVA